MSDLSLLHPDRPHENPSRSRRHGKKSLPAMTDKALHGRAARPGAEVPLPVAVRVLVWLAGLVIVAGLVVAWIR
ncbi:hypothetical protein KHC28_12380 [Ancylobacter sonchi]|uniref:hypothetical protein n=1 Tax=Ancylobacter sonchi TaxID=1937790 RepID=UPI001BD47208|nr:hypothetical protein [Ancylobacter sonchi]MBS7534452.1 hypothetical protein [Ancylobacter sonchi]